MSSEGLSVLPQEALENYSALTENSCGSTSGSVLASPELSAPNTLLEANLALSRLSKDHQDVVFGQTILAYENSNTGTWSKSLRPGDVVAFAHTRKENIDSFNPLQMEQVGNVGIVIEDHLGHKVVFSLQRKPRLGDQVQGRKMPSNAWGGYMDNPGLEPLPERGFAVEALQNFFGLTKGVEGVHSLTQALTFRPDIDLNEAIAHLGHSLHDAGNKQGIIRALMSNPLLSDMNVRIESLDHLPRGVARVWQVRNLEIDGGIRQEMKITPLSTNKDKLLLSNLFGEQRINQVVRGLEVRGMVTETLENTGHNRFRSDLTAQGQRQHVTGALIETMVSITDANNHMSAGELRERFLTNLGGA